MVGNQAGGPSMKTSVFSAVFIAAALAAGYAASSAGAEGTQLTEPPTRAYKHFGIFRSEPEGSAGAVEGKT